VENGSFKELLKLTIGLRHAICHMNMAMAVLIFKLNFPPPTQRVGIGGTPFFSDE
jgi:hypothetical protein